MAFYAYLGLPAERQSRLFLNHAFDFEFSEWTKWTLQAKCERAFRSLLFGFWSWFGILGHGDEVGDPRLFYNLF